MNSNEIEVAAYETFDPSKIPLENIFVPTVTPMPNMFHNYAEGVKKDKHLSYIAKLEAKLKKKEHEIINLKQSQRHYKMMVKKYRSG